jgi:hypothetical protein
VGGEEWSPQLSSLGGKAEQFVRHARGVAAKMPGQRRCIPKRMMDGTHLRFFQIVQLISMVMELIAFKLLVALKDILDHQDFRDKSFVIGPNRGKTDPISL